MSTEEERFAFTDAEWREYQAMPEQGYSHRGKLEFFVNRWRDARGQGAKTINEFHGDDVWRDEEGVIWVRLSELKRAVEFAARGKVTPDREALATILGIRYNDDRPDVDEPSIHDLEVADALLALFNEKGNE